MSDTSPLIHEEIKETTSSQDVAPILYQPETFGLTVTPEKVNFFGVNLMRSLISGARSLDPRTFSHYIDDTSAIELQRNIAVSWLLGQPILLEGGTSIGKTETVRRMTSLLGWELYDIAVSSQSDVDDFLGKPMVNTERTSEDDPEFIYVLGEMAEGLIAEDGKTKVIFLDEYNAASPGVVIKFHEIFDKYNKGQLYTLVNGKRVKLDKTKVKIVAATNTPGKGYLERNPLDPAQIRRWNYFKLPDRLEEQEKAGRALRVWGYRDSRQYYPRTLENLTSRGERIAIQDLHSIPGLPDLIVKIANFHTAAEKLLAEGEIGRDQPQKFIYDFNSLMFKIKEFVENFYNGDINETVQAALYFYFCNMLHSEEDRRKLMIMINDINIPQASDPRRKDRSLVSEPAVYNPEPTYPSNPEDTKSVTPIEETSSETTDDSSDDSDSIDYRDDYDYDYDSYDDVGSADYDDDLDESYRDRLKAAQHIYYDTVMNSNLVELRSENPIENSLTREILLNSVDFFSEDEIESFVKHLISSGFGAQIIESVDNFVKIYNNYGEDKAYEEIFKESDRVIPGLKRIDFLTLKLINNLLATNSSFDFNNSKLLLDLLCSQRAVKIIAQESDRENEHFGVDLFYAIVKSLKKIEDYGMSKRYSDFSSNPIISSLHEFPDSCLGDKEMEYILSLEDKNFMIDSILNRFINKFTSLSHKTAQMLADRGFLTLLNNYRGTDIFAITESEIDDILDSY